ncbi:MAG: holo-ACP synthase [Propionibacteriaceae bacterium]|nr:holo-ACP synthase [Propionibacteriaceae bacterium]
MILGVGVDVCDLERWAQMARRRPQVVRRLLTAAEAELTLQSQAARFAAKEALAKALGGPAGLSWLEVEVVTTAGGRPSFAWSGGVARAAADLGVTRHHLSLSHDGGVAVAVVVLEGEV